MENITNFEQERINVELYMEKLLDIKEDCEYGSDARNKLIKDGVRLVRKLIEKVYDEGLTDGRKSEKIDFVGTLSNMATRYNDEVVMDFINKDNEEDTLKCFDALLDSYEKARTTNQVA
jgi:hypothetical protein